MSTATAALWDIILKVLALVGLAIGGAFSYFQYFDGLKRQRESEARESRKPFLAQRQELYGQAMRAVAELAIVRLDKEQLRKAEETFWFLYWGPLASVESPAIEGVMVRFGDCLQDKTCKAEMKKDLSLELAHIIRAEYAESWDVSLPPLNRS
jgi:hypothetical protein